MKENEKQAIEEMANVLQVGVCIEADITQCRKMDDCSICKATRLYNAGYRKQREGRWEKRTFIIFDSEKVGYKCSECNTTWDTETKFCPNCGAYMKGANDERAD